MTTEHPTDQLAGRVRVLSWVVGFQGVLLILLTWLVSALIWGEKVTVDGLSESSQPVESEAYGDYEDEMRAYFERMRFTLDGEVRKAGANPSEYLPTDEEIDDAVETRTMHSDESRRVDQQLRLGFDKFQLDWTIAKPEK